MNALRRIENLTPQLSRLAGRAPGAAARRSVYTGGSAPLAEKRKFKVSDLVAAKAAGRKLVMGTAYTAMSARHCHEAGLELVLVGDSLGMVEMGEKTTQYVTMDEMLHHCKIVTKTNPSSLIVADMPFGSYEVSDEDAVRNAFRFVKEARVDMVKLEGGRKAESAVRAIVNSGIAVMGHIGLLPQSISVLGSYRARGRTRTQALALVDDAIALQRAGAACMVIECVPAGVADLITRAVQIPTLGIGAGKHTDGQVLVFHDMLGINDLPNDLKPVPPFVKRYASLGVQINQALLAYASDVRSQSFPDAETSPYTLSDAALADVRATLQEREWIPRDA